MSQASRATMSFNLQGDNTTITYVEMSQGPNQLTYQSGQVNRSFTGGEIHEHTIEEVGKLLTVQLPSLPDAGFDTLNLLLPEIDFSGSSQVEIETLAILGHRRGNIRRPQIETYRVLNLKGTVTSQGSSTSS